MHAKHIAQARLVHLLSSWLSNVSYPRTSVPSYSRYVNYPHSLATKTFINLEVTQP